MRLLDRFVDIHHANHIRQGGEVKVGGHQASSASLSTIMTTLYYSVLRPQDRVADKPYASPISPAIRDLAGNQASAVPTRRTSW
ncbi:pyruvate dehydrogenase complex dehydrogenase (E1) component [Rhizobium leguminosarum]